MKPGDVLTSLSTGGVLVYKILSSGVRRGPAEEARTLYEDMTPKPQPDPVNLRREARRRTPDQEGQARAGSAERDQ